jgi:phosphoribosylanthranilate isomerase
VSEDVAKPLSRLWIKICGLTTAEGVSAAVTAGADAIGFVFATSKRQIAPARAVELAQLAPTRIERVAVMLHPSQQELDAVLSQFQPDVLQTDVDDLPQLQIPASLRVIPVVRAAAATDTLPSRILFEGAISGVGAVADWNAAALLARRTQLVLAGGLHKDNVTAAVRAVQPYGVDVSSGVEREPAVKDRDKIHAFIEAARAASGAK